MLILLENSRSKTAVSTQLSAEKPYFLRLNVSTDLVEACFVVALNLAVAFWGEGGRAKTASEDGPMG